MEFMEYLWPKGNTLRCEYKENFFDVVHLSGEFSSKFMKMRKGICKPEDRRQAIVNVSCVLSNTNPDVPVCSFSVLFHSSVISV